MSTKGRELIKKIIILLLLVALVGFAIRLALTGKQEQAVVYGVELLKNGGFDELASDGLPTHWWQEAYLDYSDISSYASIDGKDGQAAKVVNYTPNDARFAQTVQVQPNTTYLLSGFIKAQAEGGRGANLSIADVYVFSEAVYDTADAWQAVELYGRTGPKQTELTVFARLGGYSGEATGEASFDSLSLMAISEDELPGNAYVTSWQKPDTQPAASEAPGKGSFAIPFLLIFALFAILLTYLARVAQAIDARPRAQDEQAKAWVFLVVLLAFALITRLWLAHLIPGFPVDISAFRAWSHNMADAGPGGFYLLDGHRDYPPGYMLVLWPIGLLGQLLGSGVTGLMVKLPAILADLGIILFLFLITKKKTSALAAVTLSALYAFNPLTYLAGAAWGQVDALPSLLLLIALWFVMSKRWRYALPIYVLAVLMKPQALMAGPLGLVALVLDLYWRREEKPIKDVLIGAGAAVLVALAVALPFFNQQNGLPWLLSLYGNTMSFYNYATVNATNLFFLFGQNWASIGLAAPLLLRIAGGLVILLPIAWMLVRKLRQRPMKLDANAKVDLALYALAALLALGLLVPMNLSTAGILLMAAVFVAVAHMLYKGRSLQHLPLLAGILLSGFSILGTMMHERYLFLAVAMYTLAFIQSRDKRVFYLLLFTSALCFLNTGLAMDRGIRIGGGAGNLDAPLSGLVSDSAWLEYALSFLSLPLTAWSLHLGYTLCRPSAQILPFTRHTATATTKEAAMQTFVKKREQARFDRKDALLILLVTAMYAVLALTNLGSTISPQTAWIGTPEQSEALLDLGKVKDFRLLFFAGIHRADADFTVEVSADGEEYVNFPFQIAEGGLYAWRYLGHSYQDKDGRTRYNSQPRELYGRYVRISGTTARLTLLEVVAQDAFTGENLPFVTASEGAQALIDEQDTLKGQPSWYNSMYFDEIYHARTGLEQYNALIGQEPNRIYEVSHPPLGKLMMTFAISVFGMTPFGWRFAGAFAGVLMLPGLYLLGKQLTKKRGLGLLSMLLMAFDFMHFAQTRIATIDSFVTLFIIYAYFFMFRYMMQDPLRTPLKNRLLQLFLSGLMMGLAIASKWPGIYAGIGLAVLFFWTLIQDAIGGWRLSQADEQQTAILGNEKGLAQAYAKRWQRDILYTLAACLLFFVAIPALIYYLSYIPVYIATPGGLTLKKVIDNNLYMFGYHAKAGFGADHPFSSPWYSWPLIGKPLYLYSGGVQQGTGSVIWTLGNPMVWWGGLVGLVLTAIAAAAPFMFRNRRQAALSREEGIAQAHDRRPLMLLIAFAAQYLPWALVPRGTYIYHYFPSVPFIILCVALMIDYLYQRFGKAARITSIVFCVLAGLLFVAYFPYISGLRVSVDWLEAIRALPIRLYY